MDEREYAKGFIDKLKGIEEGDYVRVIYKDGKILEGFYLDTKTVYVRGLALAGTVYDEKGKYLYVKNEEEGRLNRYTEEKQYKLVKIKNEKGFWIDRVANITIIDNYVFEEGRSLKDYIFYEVISQRFRYMREYKTITTGLKFELEDWERIIERVNPTNISLEEFMDKVIDIKEEFDGSGIEVLDNRGNTYIG